jgi:hypothetical protein
MNAAARPMAQEVFIGISRSRVSANSTFKTRDSARGVKALARVLCWYQIQIWRLCSEINAGLRSSSLAVVLSALGIQGCYDVIGLTLRETQFFANYLRR